MIKVIVVRACKTLRCITHSRMRPWLKLQTLETWQEKGPAIESINGINPHSEKAVRLRLVERNNARINFHHIEQVFPVADSCKAIFFLVRREAREKVLLRSLKPEYFLLQLFRKRYLAQEPFGIGLVHASKLT